MKKLFITLSLFALPLLAINLNAKEVTKIYYGEKANDSMLNPCKGKVVAICARITTIIDDLDPVNPNPASTGLTITTILYDADGNEIRRNVETVLQGVDQTMDDILNDVTENAIVTIE